jgi:hypothetical protein
MTPILLLPGSIIGASFVVFTIVNFDFERLSIRRIFSGAIGAIMALICGVVLAVLLFGGYIMWGP